MVDGSDAASSFSEASSNSGSGGWRRFGSCVSPRFGVIVVDDDM